MAAGSFNLSELGTAQPQLVLAFYVKISTEKYQAKVMTIFEPVNKNEHSKNNNHCV